MSEELEHTHSYGDGCAYHGEIPKVNQVDTPKGLAAVLDIEPHTVARWAERRDQTHFPLPVHSYGRTIVYSIMEVQAWFDIWSRTRGTYYGSRS